MKLIVINEQETPTCIDQWWHGHPPSHGSMGKCELGCWNASSRIWKSKQNTRINNQNWGSNNLLKEKSIPLVFLDPMQVVTSHNDGSHHLCTMASSSNDTPSDGYITSEGALLVNVCTCRMDADSQEKGAKETDVQTYHAVSWGKLIVGYIQFWTSSNNKRCQIIKE